MRASRLNENRLIEMHRRKYLNELLDFCLYESCLQEETAEAYFDYLYNKVHTANGNTRNAFDREQKDLKDKNAYKELLKTTAEERFKQCKEQQGDNDGVVENYFEGDSLIDFIKDFETYVKNQHTNKRITDQERMKIQDCFFYYVGPFC